MYVLRLTTPLVLAGLVACATGPRQPEPAPAIERETPELVAAVQRGPDRVYMEVKGVT